MLASWGHLVCKDLRVGNMALIVGGCVKAVQELVELQLWVVVGIGRFVVDWDLGVEGSFETANTGLQMTVREEIDKK